MNKDWYKTKRPVSGLPLIDVRPGMKMQELPVLVPLDEAAKYFGVRKSSLGAFARRGLKIVKIGRHKYTTPEWIANFISGGMK